jgi:acetyltransferase-like isoleucine patch superfamily enzyme
MPLAGGVEAPIIDLMGFSSKTDSQPRTDGEPLRRHSALRRVIGEFYVTPLFRARCESSGPRLSVCFMPHVTGPVRIYVGADVTINGKIRIDSRHHTCDHPTLRIGNNVVIGDDVTLLITQQMVIQDKVRIGDNSTITDNPEHRGSVAR